jgi:hypothetical protein
VASVDAIVNLSVLFFSRKIAEGFLESRGMDHFILKEIDGPSFRLDPERLEEVVELGRLASLDHDPALPVSDCDLFYCRRQLRRELIQELAVSLLDAGY